MQLVIADWRLAVERVPGKLMNKNTTTARVEREARKARMLQQVENERRAVQNSMLLMGGR